jgi:hypothetical protein
VYARKEDARAAVRAWQEANRDRYNGLQQSWRERNPERYRELNARHNRRQRTQPAMRYTRTRLQARRRGLAFDLTYEQFLALWGQPCAYCGIEIDTIGLDRVDNTAGYTPDNVLPCCSLCNRMKYTMGWDEFLRHIRRIADHQRWYGRVLREA